MNSMMLLTCDTTFDKPTIRRRVMLYGKTRMPIIIVALLMVSLAPVIDGKPTGKHNASNGCSCHYASSATPNHDFPSTYNPGQTYSIQISVTGGVSGTGGGFSLEVDKGSYSNAGSGVSFSGSSATHSNPNSRSWNLDWTAPSAGSGTVSVALATLAANLNGQNTGDAWGTTTHSITETVTPNDAPSVSQVAISPSSTAKVNEDLVLSYSYFDSDGNSESGTQIQWVPNGGSAVSQYDGLTTLPSSATAVGDSWVATVKPSDGTDYGTMVESATVSIQDIDSDGDGTLDGDDAFPDNASETTDTDSDGVGDNADAFPDDASETSDSDGDGVGDNADAFPNDSGETHDSDFDGVGDNADAFPDDASETSDSDGDGVGDNSDAFPDDANETADLDSDGVGDNSDAFPTDPSETTDSDSDGVGDNADTFPNNASETVDTDLDGTGDNSDAFPLDYFESHDSDGDGVGDNSDAFPFDENETVDSDQDGVGDNSDAFPNNSNESMDSDGDGVGDNADAFPDDANETVDSDSDGVGDNSDEFPDDSNESMDSDSDGVGDNADDFPNDADETLDSDGDGVGDNAQLAAEQKASTVAENEDSNTSLFIIIGGIITIALGAAMFTMRKKSNPLTESEPSFNQTMMVEPAVPMGQHTPLPIPATQATVVNQWTDEAGNTWRAMDNGTTMWWNGTDWQQA